MSGAGEGELLKRHRLHVHMTKCLKRFDHINHNRILINLVKSYLIRISLDLSEYVAKPTEEKTKEEGEKAKDHVAHIRPKKKKIHHEGTNLMFPMLDRKTGTISTKTADC